MDPKLQTLYAASLACSSLVASAQESPSLEKLIEQAGQGNASAQLALAIRYRDGKGVEANLAEAMRWGHRAADTGNAAAMDFVGHAYLRGAGVSRSPEIAAGYFRAAADDSATAAFNLGQCYFGAQGVDQDVPKALEFWEKAATMGHGRAAATAAMAYLSGEGIPANPAKARALARRAADANDPSGLVLMGELHFQAGEIDQARTLWTKVAGLHPVAATGQPTQPSAEMASQQGADLLKLIEWRQRAPEPGRFALIRTPHIHQGYNNCGSTSCAMVARFQGAQVGGWDFKRLCPSPIGTGTDWDELLKASAKINLSWKLVTFPPDEAGFQKGEEFLRAELDAGRPVIIDFKFYGPHYANGEAGHTLNVVGYLAKENLYILSNPAIATPGLNFITAADLEKFWRSNYYSHLANKVMSRPAIAIDTTELGNSLPSAQ
jgi:TPR repeat protein